MATIVGVIFVISFILLIVGLVKPSLVIRWGEEGKTRKKVVKLFLLT